MVSKRVEEELERRRDEIEAEVLRRVEEAKKVLEAQMLEEMEKRKQEQLEEDKRREVRTLDLSLYLDNVKNSKILRAICTSFSKINEKDKLFDRISKFVER